MASGVIAVPNFIKIYTDITQLTNNVATATTNDIFQAMSNWSIAIIKVPENTYIYNSEMDSSGAWANIIMVRFSDRYQGIGIARPYNKKLAYILRLSSGGVASWEQLTLT